MFVAWRDLRHARGRFSLMVAVISLITLLVGFLAALTAGLGRASTSAIVDLPADRLVFSHHSGDDPSFTESQVDQDQWKQWGDVSGVSWATPLGVAQTRATSQGTTAAITALGVASQSPLLDTHLSPGHAVLSAGAADALDARAGDTVTIGPHDVVIDAVTTQDADFAHTPALWLNLDDWQATGARSNSERPVATVVALGLAPGAASTALTAADTRLGTTTVTLSGARSAISSYQAEHLSLTMMQGFLLAISALVVSVFFAVWTINRGRDIAVIKALGGSDSYLLRDAIGQAAVVLALGTGIGALFAAAFGLLASRVMPVVVSTSTILLPAALLGVLGLVGGIVAVARITRIDPHSALAAR